MNSTFWEKRLTLSMMITLTGCFLVPLFTINLVSNFSDVAAAWMRTPFHAVLFNSTSFVWNKIGDWPFALFGTNAQAFFDYWNQGFGDRIAVLFPPIAIAGLAFLTGMDLVKFLLPETPRPHGSARFASTGEERLHRAKTSNALIVGAQSKRKPYTYARPEHLMTMAPTRSGKGASLIIPNLLTAERGMLVIDPKGENAQVTMRQRQTFGPVHVLDPFNASGLANASFNPLAAMSIDDPNFVDDALTLANALITANPHVSDPHWSEGACELVQALIMLVVAAEPPERCNLVTVREHLTCGPDKFDQLIEIMATSNDAGGAIAAIANAFLPSGSNPSEVRSFRSNARTQTKFLDSPQLRETLKRSSFDFADLKSSSATVYLVLPRERMQSHGRWIRLLVGRALQDIERSRVKPKVPVLFLLDEFASVGDMPHIKAAYGYSAGFGLQMWAFLQDWPQLEELYGKGAHSFAANTGVFQAFNVNDEMTARYVSTLSGDTTQFNAADPAKTTARKLLTPDEAMHLGDDKMFLKFKGTHPIIARKAYYFNDAKLTRIADKSDFH